MVSAGSLRTNRPATWLPKGSAAEIALVSTASSRAPPVKGARILTNAMASSNGLKGISLKNAENAQTDASESLAAHAERPPARPARPLAAGRRDRGHRPWARPRRALERPDQGRARLFGGAALRAGRAADGRAQAAAGASGAADGAIARCAGIRHRRSDQPVQIGGRHRL